MRTVKYLAGFCLSFLIVSNAAIAAEIRFTMGEYSENTQKSMDKIARAFEAENLTKVFNHGYTTKVNGHGLGLHSCANTMKECGASIQVASEGAGLGSTFTMVFPLEASQAA